MKKLLLGLLIGFVLVFNQFSVVISSALPEDSYAKLTMKLDEDNQAISNNASIGRWNFEEGSGTEAINTGGKNLHGKIYNAQYSQHKNVGNYSLKFDGQDSYVAVSNDKELNITDAITISCWFKVSEIDRYNFLVSKPEEYFLCGSANWTNKPFLQLYIGGDQNSNRKSIYAKSEIEANKWYHLAGTYDSNTRKLKLYVNGKISNWVTLSGLSNYKIWSSESDLMFGRGKWKPYVDGYLDDIHIFSEAISESEVYRLFTAGSSAKDTEKPSTPQNVKAKATSSSSVYLSWTASVDNDIVSKYEVYRDNELVGSSCLGSYFDKGLSSGTTYTYKVYSYDRTGNKSNESESVSVNVPEAVLEKILPHPRMFFYAEDIPLLRSKANTTHEDMWFPIINKANSIMSQPVKTFSEYFPQYPNNTPSPGMQKFYDAADRLYTIAFAYIITGDFRYAKLTRDYLLEYESWPAWGDTKSFSERDLCLAAMISSNSIAYDWIYDFLSPEEQVKISNTIARHAQEQYEAATTSYNSEWLNWWGNSYAQNHCLINHNSIGTAALVLEGEDKRTETWFKRALDVFNIDKRINEGIKDGTWHEGIQYQNMKLLESFPFYYNLNHLKGKDLFADEYFRNFVTWRLQNYLAGSTKCVMPYSTYVPHWGGADVHRGSIMLRFLASRYNNEQAQWIADNINKPASTDYEHVLEFLVYDATIKSKQPSFPETSVFSDLEGVIWRSGIGKENLTFALKTGPYGGRFIYDSFCKGDLFDNKNIPNVGHGHGDANTFYLYKGNKELAGEMSEKYKASDSKVHNTILVDGKSQYVSYHHKAYKETDGRLEEVYELPDFNYLCADATKRYREKSVQGDKPGDFMLDEFRRHVIFVRPNYFIMLDNIRSSKKHQYDWLCQFGEDMISNNTSTGELKGDWLKLANGDDILGVKIIAPCNFNHEFGFRTHAYVGSDKKHKQYVSITPTEDTANTRFITVLYPTDKEAWNDNKPDIESAKDIELLGNTEIGAALRVCWNGIQDHIIKYGEGESIVIDEYLLSGRVASIIKNGKNISKIFLGGGKSLKDLSGERTLIQSEEEITIETVYSGTSLNIFSKDKLSKVKIYAPDTAENSVTFNNKQIDASKSGDYILIENISAIRK